MFRDDPADWLMLLSLLAIILAGCAAPPTPRSSQDPRFSASVSPQLAATTMTRIDLLGCEAMSDADLVVLDQLEADGRIDANPCPAR